MTGADVTGAAATGAAATRLTRRQADELVASVVRRLRAGGLLPAGARFDAEAFHRLRERVHACFDVPQTSVTPLMARLLFAIGDGLRPRRLLVIGSYCGNTLVWLAGRAVLDDDTGAVAIGCDVDEQACGIARSNFRRLAANHIVGIETADGHRVAAAHRQPWDLLLLDADSATDRKAVYESLLDAALPWLPPGSVVLAHDTALPLFAGDLAGYLRRTRDRSVFAASAHLAVDPCGLEMSVVSAGADGGDAPSGRSRR